MVDYSKNERSGFNNPFPLNAQFREGQERLIVKVINNILEHALDIECDSVRFESNELELKIRYVFTGMFIEELSLPGFYHTPVREGLAELAASDLGIAEIENSGSFVVLWDERLMRVAVHEMGENETHVSFSPMSSE